MFQNIDAVFSSEFTGKMDPELTNSPSIQRISFYSLYSNIQKSRDSKNEKLEEKLQEKEAE